MRYREEAAIDFLIDHDIAWSHSGIFPRCQSSLKESATHSARNIANLDIAERVGGLIWAAKAAEDDDPEDGAAGALVPA